MNRRIFLLGVCGSLASPWSALQAAQPAAGAPAPPKSPLTPTRPTPLGTVDDRLPGRRAADRAVNADEVQIEPPPPATLQPDASDYEESPSDRILRERAAQGSAAPAPAPSAFAPQQAQPQPFFGYPACPPPVCQPCPPVYYQPCGHRRRRHHRRGCW